MNNSEAKPKEIKHREVFGYQTVNFNLMKSGICISLSFLFDEAKIFFLYFIDIYI